MNAKLNVEDYNASTDYRALLGEDSWSRLHPAIQRRFNHRQRHSSVCYQGVMSYVFLSFFGLLLAHLLRFIGTPLALYNGKNIPVVVNVYPAENDVGLIWDRAYDYPNKKSHRVKSTKIIETDAGLIECVGAGFVMQLKAYEHEGALCFESSQFYWKIGLYKLQMPEWLTPGKTWVIQRAIDNEQFQFYLNVTHPLLGLMYEQDGIFK
ncbi:MAG: DUF4166 domain-containing protein [Pseudomonadales bacterium]|nr:DUF4166 domain-containing protein [Pseudomonadales bacterium]